MLGRGPCGPEFRHDIRQLRHSHVDDHRVLGVCEETPVGQGAIAQLSADEGDTAREAPVGERQLGGGGGGERRGDSRDHGAGDAVRGQHLELLAAASENQRIAALEARHALALSGEAHQQLVDAPLLIGPAGLPADEDPLGIAPRAIQHRLAHQAVVENHVRSLQQLQRPQREQVRIAGAGSNQVDLAESPAGGGRGGGELRGQELARQRPLRPLPRALQHERCDGA